ncbi:MAG: hypothetical protein Q9227_008427 [Pyrenula ochraceoflavens]
MEIVKLVQWWLLNDIDMYDQASNTPLEARTSTINEELGQVSHIFSDKTGTLTNNSMHFRKISLAGTAWLHDRDLREEEAKHASREKLMHKKRNLKGKRAASRRSTVSLTGTTRRSNISGINASENSHRLARPRLGQEKQHMGGRVEDMLEYIHRKPNTLFARRARFFLTAIALCHTCVPENNGDDNITFQATSPDELALVKAAQDFGYHLLDRHDGRMTIKVLSEDVHYETYEVLDVVEFSSARKRMSIIIRMPDNRICVFCKGADSTIINLLRLADLARSKVTDVERRANQRKSLEAGEAMRRKSEMQSRKNSIPRLSMSRTSMGTLPGRRSSLRSRKASLRDGIDNWLKERETDVELRNQRDSVQFYSPRPSVQWDMHLSPRTSTQHVGRASLGYLEGQSSIEADELGEVVEEAMVINDGLVFERCFQHINDFATDGLRTLLYGSRYLTEEEYHNWKTIYSRATTSLVDRQERIEEAADMIETQFELVGATAIEDRLQEGVPEAIDKLRRANIKVWMLTGDKRETAINVGKSARLVKDYSTIIILDHRMGDIVKQLVESTQNLKSGEIAHSVIVVDGQTLAAVESELTTKTQFLELSVRANTVICCRASPSQKASLVSSIRHNVKNAVTLAIGDGANDIAMIQEAHVGIGITGKEGLQAARSSDYSIAQFRFLLKLLLVHGRWNYDRICKYTLGTFWKEFLFYLTQALYQRWNGYTGTSLYESWSLSMFNSLFTSLPVIALGAFEKDLAASTLLAVPELYTFGQRNQGFNISLYLFWTFTATCEAVIIYFTALGLYGRDAIPSSDRPGVSGTNDLFAMGALIYSACVIIIFTKLQFLELHYKTWTVVIVLILSVGTWFFWNVLFSSIYSTTSDSAVIYRVRDSLLHRFGATPLWWLTLILAVASAVLFEITIKAVKAGLAPSDVDVFQALERDPEVKRRFEEASAEELRAGWDRGEKKSSAEIEREIVEKEREEKEREEHVRELLERPRTMEGQKSMMTATETGLGAEGVRRRTSMPVAGLGIGLEAVDSSEEEAKEEQQEGSTAAAATTASGPSERATTRGSLDVQELFTKGFGVVWKGAELK